MDHADPIWCLWDLCGNVQMVIMKCNRCMLTSSFNEREEEKEPISVDLWSHVTPLSRDLCKTSKSRFCSMCVRVCVCVSRCVCVCARARTRLC